MDWKPSPVPEDIGAVPMQQHPHYARVCHLMGGSISGYASEGGRAYAQILARRWPVLGVVRHLVRGPIWPDSAPSNDDMLSLVRMMRTRTRAALILTEPVMGRDPGEGAGMLPVLTPTTYARLDLSGSTQSRLARQHGKWRNRLRRAQDSALNVTQTGLPKDASHWLLQREAAQARARGYRALPPSFSHAWRAVNGAGSTRLFVAHFKSEPVAAMLFLLHGASATYQIGWSDAEGRALNAHALLLWQASEWLSERGYLWVDLGSIDTETAPGLARFKLGSGAEAYHLGATWMSAFGTSAVRRLTRPWDLRSRQSRPVPG